MSDTGDDSIDSAVGDTGLLLSVTAAAAGRNLNLALETVALRARTFSILELAVVSTDGINQRRLAETLQLNPSQIVALVDSLAADGLVERCLDESDRRNKLIRGTEKGKLCYAEARSIADRALDQTLGALDLAERATLHRLLRRVVGSALN